MANQPITVTKAALAKYQVNFGAVTPQYEGLEAVSVERRLPSKDPSLVAGIDMWQLTFETYTFCLVFDANEHRAMDGPVGRMALLSVLFRTNQGSEDFKEAARRFWFRQIDEIMGFMPQLDRLFPAL